MDPSVPILRIPGAKQEKVFRLPIKPVGLPTTYVGVPTWHRSRLAAYMLQQHIISSGSYFDLDQTFEIGKPYDQCPTTRRPATSDLGHRQ